MKKIVLAMVALMAVTFSFAETKSNDVDKRFDMTCNMHRLAVVLDLNEWQMEAVEAIYNGFTNEMASLASVKGPMQRFLVRQAFRKDAHQMKRVLNEKQFNDYMRIMASTYRNRRF